MGKYPKLDWVVWLVGGTNVEPQGKAHAYAADESSALCGAHGNFVRALKRSARCKTCARLHRKYKP